jgi:hypothetical protein
MLLGGWLGSCHEDPTTYLHPDPAELVPCVDGLALSTGLGWDENEMAGWLRWQGGVGKRRRDGCSDSPTLLLNEGLCDHFDLTWL